MGHQLPTSPTSARIGAGAEEPWQLVARSGAGLLAVGLSMPVVISQLWMWCFTLFGIQVSEWSAVLIAIRGLHLVANVVAGVGLYRLIQAPVVRRERGTRALGLFAASVAASAVLSTGGVVMSLIMSVFGLAAWLAVIDVARTIDGVMRDDGRPAGVWMLLMVVTVLTSISMWMLSAGAFTGSLVAMSFGVTRLVEVVLLIVGFMGLRRLLR